MKAGTATVTVTGKSDGLGSVEKQFTISPAVVNRDDITITPEKALYTGNPVTLESVKYKGKELTEGVDYTVVYYNNINVTTEGSKATAVITFRGNYYGTVGKTFEIGSVITDAVITDVMLPADSCEYNGREQRPEPIVKSWDTVLEKDKDYTVTYKDNIDPGRATVTVTGTGETATDQATGEGQGAGTDQTAGAYKGVITKHFDIVRADIARGETTLEWTKTLYNGKDQRPAVTIVLDGSELREGYDYSVKYADNKEIGRATATVKGIGNYTGTVTKVFKILDSRIANARIQVNPSTVQYDGKPQTPAVYVYLGEKILTEKEEYTLSYSDNTEPGTATVTIKGIGHYEGTATAAFTIEGTKPAGDDAKPSDDDTKKVTVKATGITKLSKIRKGFTGYQVRYSTKSSMAGAKSIKVKGYKNTVKKITKLKAKKKYYVQVRVYKVKNGKTYYSKWSAKKWVKTL